MADETQRSEDPIESQTFLSRVNRLAKNRPSQSSFHRTRPPFVRLREVVGHLRIERGARHPSSCQAQDCAAPLTEGYHRRADGLTLCPACFQRCRQADHVEGD